ncbi:putative polyketide synthase [Phaeosphaeriaceae sp. PMI808]|nr:putative polyketide synthase [Phaeosphaeriaceae sp. PMI808]
MATTNGDAQASHLPEPIAIISMACRLPGHASSPHKLWEFLRSGGTAVSHEVPNSRFNSTGHFDTSGRPGTLKALSGMFIENIDPALFDAQFFNLTRADVIAMDPQQRQLLEVVYECFENGGIPLERVSGTETGCFVGNYTVDYHDIQNKAPSQRPPGMTVGIGRAMLSNRISHFYNLKGPSWTIDTACSGGLIGVDVACQYLRARKLNGAIIAAANLWLSPEHTQELGTMRAAYSTTGKCHAFDAKADGYCRAEAVNAVYLKRLSDAIKDGDPIRAVIRGTANNSDGWTPGINSPSAEAQSAVIRAAYTDAGIESDHYAETGFLECHGTGTPAGDPLELQGAAFVLSPMRDPSRPLIIGSIKSNIGHSEPAAGISGFIKATLAVEQGYIPGNPTFVNPNPSIDFEKLRIRATRPGIAWPATSNNYRRASINSFGYGGSNAHVVLDNAEQYLQAGWPTQHKRRPYVSSYLNPSDILSFRSKARDRSSKTLVQRPQILVFSANDKGSLKNQVDALSAHLLDPRVKVKLSDLAYTLSERRTRHFWRSYSLAFSTKTGNASPVPEAAIQSSQVPDRATKVGFVFTGQGAQWSQMGAELVQMFPKTVKVFLKELDLVLQALPRHIRPAWSLLEELIESRSSDHLSKPEYSQPLVTALQLAQMRVLEVWNVLPHVVVGHSSGEIATACSAGFIRPAEAILIAYFRGLAARDATPERPMGMMAVGLSAASVRPYIETEASKEGVLIACYNSPTSITLSGPIAALTKVLDRLKADGHFSRMLRVEVAYHSFHLKEAACHYEELIEKYVQFDRHIDDWSARPVQMVSSLTEQLVTSDQVRTAAYWRDNMMSPVLFEGACKSIFSDTNLDPDFLIEIGPSNALAGPVAQTLKAQGVTNTKYVGASKRGKDSIHAIFDVAGQLFLRNAEISLGNVNHDETLHGLSEPATIIDLPNYKWNHSTRYWYENLASLEWRFKPFVEHDLLGSKVLGTLWQNPSWHKRLRLSDLPWLRDHKIGSEILFPAAGYIAMAMEAVRQVEMSSKSEPEGSDYSTKNHQYRLENVEFSRSLVLEDDEDINIMLTLTSMEGKGHGWWEYKIMSLPESELEILGLPPSTAWTENSRGLIRIQLDIDQQSNEAPPQIYALPFAYPSSAELWHKTMAKVGYAYGPAFQTQLEFECMEGNPTSRALISLEAPSSKWEPQSEYPLHVAPLDGCIQSVFPSYHNGSRSSFSKLLLPRHINQITISGRTWRSGIAVLSSVSKNELSNASVYDVTSKAFIMAFEGLAFLPMNVNEKPYPAEPCARVVWKPDFRHLDSSEKLQKALLRSCPSREADLHELIDLAIHKMPQLKVFEFSFGAVHADSVWLPESPDCYCVRASSGGYHFASNNASTVLAIKQRITTLSLVNARSSLLDLFSEKFSPPPDGSGYNLVLVKGPWEDGTRFEMLTNNVHRLLAKGGTVIWYNTLNIDASEDRAMTSDDKAKSCCDPYRILENMGILKIHRISEGRCVVAEIGHEQEIEKRVHEANSDNGIALVGFVAEKSSITSDIVEQLQMRGWNITRFGLHGQNSHNIAELPSRSLVLVLDEIVQTVLSTASEEQWSILKILIERDCDLLWVTQGSQFKVTDPSKAICHGLFRTIRAEAPTSHITTLDFEFAALENTTSQVITIDQILRGIKRANTLTTVTVEHELAERDGLLYVSRIRPDELVNQFKAEEDAHGPPPVMKDLHGSQSVIRLALARRGDLETLQFEEGQPVETLKPDEVEVEIYATGCNFKDIDMAMGIGPGIFDSFGFEAAGVINRLGQAVVGRHVGQRVALLGQGCFANRTVVSAAATLPLQDGLAYTEAAALPVAFLTAIHGLCDLANVQRGQRVLIDCAAIGISLACFQICQSLDCEVVIVVDSQAKKDVLFKDFGVCQDCIQLSGAPHPGITRDATEEYGMNVIIHQCRGGTSRHEYWRHLVPGGTVIAVDMAARSCPTQIIESKITNFSFHSLDATTLPSTTVSHIFSRLAKLIQNGSAKPLPIHQILKPSDTSKALQILRDQANIGNIIVSYLPEGTTRALVRPKGRTAKAMLKPNLSYLLVGGLRGICGSLAVHLALQGARYISVMSRSGYEDSVSQGVIATINALGCTIDLMIGDVTSIEDVRNCFRSTSVPVGGIIQGAAVFKDRTFESMSQADYHAATACKVQGTIHLHTVSIEMQQPIAFFTMLSSISGIVGTKGQANYAGGNAFQDAFASYRRTMGLPSISIDLGPVQDVGVMQGNDDLQARFDNHMWVQINERLLRRLFDYALLQQEPDSKDRLNTTSEAQMLTGLTIPQPVDSELLGQPRFTGLRAVESGDEPKLVAGANAGGDTKLQSLFHLMQASDLDKTAVLSAVVTVIGNQLRKQLRLTDAIEPTRQVLQYGMDSLAAVEFRNWLRTTLKVELTTLDIVNSPSVVRLCEKVVAKMSIS